MPSPQFILNSYFRPLRSLPCWLVTAEYGSWISLHFGEPRLRISEGTPNAPLRSMRQRAVFVEGDFLIWIEMGEWELFQDKKLAFHSEQRRAYLRRAATNLDGQQIKQVEVVAKKRETHFTFDFGSELIVRPTAEAKPEEPLWHVYGKHRCLSMLANGNLEYGPSRNKILKRIRAGNYSFTAKLNNAVDPHSVGRQ